MLSTFKWLRRGDHSCAQHEGCFVVDGEETYRVCYSPLHLWTWTDLWEAQTLDASASLQELYHSYILDQKHDPAFSHKPLIGNENCSWVPREACFSCQLPTMKSENFSKISCPLAFSLSLILFSQILLGALMNFSVLLHLHAALLPPRTIPSKESINLRYQM